MAFGWQRLFSDIAMCFPNSYTYPRRQTPWQTSRRGWISISENGDRVGEGDIEFTGSGSFGYIIYSQGKPVYYAANQKTIEVSPFEVRIQT